MPFSGDIARSVGDRIIVSKGIHILNPRPVTMLPCLGLCRCDEVKGLETGRLSWKTDGAQCNHEGPEKSETGGFELEKMLKPDTCV